MTNYVVLVDTGSGFKEIGRADKNTPKEAQEAVLTSVNKNADYAAGTVVAVPVRSWNPQPFKLVTQPKLELG